MTFPIDRLDEVAGIIADLFGNTWDGFSDAVAQGTNLLHDTGNSVGSHIRALRPIVSMAEAELTNSARGTLINNRYLNFADESLELTNLTTGEVQNTRPYRDGSFTFVDLSPGDYSLYLASHPRDSYAFTLKEGDRVSGIEHVQLCSF